MKAKITTLFLLIISISAKSDVVINFDLDYCIDSSSHIFRAKIINEKGLLEINQVFYGNTKVKNIFLTCLLYTSPSPRDATLSRMPSSA